MATKYRLRTGTTTRTEFEPEDFKEYGEKKDADGNYLAATFQARYKAPHEFVPSPGELVANKHRMVATGSVPEDSLDAANGRLNTNPADLVTLRRRVRTQDERITAKGIQDAIDAVKQANSVEQIDKFLDEEMQNRPRPRKGVLKALDSRREELAAGAEPSE